MTGNKEKNYVNKPIKYLSFC